MAGIYREADESRQAPQADTGLTSHAASTKKRCRRISIRRHRFLLLFLVARVGGPLCVAGVLAFAGRCIAVVLRAGLRLRGLRRAAVFRRPGPAARATPYCGRPSGRSG